MTTYIGTPCHRGHDGTRDATGHCVECRRAASVARYAANPEKMRARNTQYYAANPEKERARAAAWQRANPDKARARGAAWRAANPEKKRASADAYRAANPEKVRARDAEWKRANPAACAAIDARRRAREIAAPGNGVTVAQWKNCLAASLGLCAYCGERKPLTMDHIEPLSLGGAHDIENIAAVCQSCNCSKNDTPLLVWLARKAFARVA